MLVPQKEQLMILQQALKDTGRYFADTDGVWGPLTEAGILLGFTDGPDTPLTDEDYEASGRRVNVPAAYIKAFATVEAAGAGFFQGKPKILPEPHRFSKMTQRRFDQSNPDVSYPSWGQRPYPKTQNDRYSVLLKMISLDAEAGLGAASYGKFQILGSNYAECGYLCAMEFAFAMAKDEPTQLEAWERFIVAAGILKHLRAGDWAKVARMYNGPAYKKNAYDTKMAAAAKKFGA